MNTDNLSSEPVTANSVNTVLTAGNFKPILFSAPMVRAILRGEKTQTRRIINPQPIEDSESGYVFDGKHKSLYKNDSTHEDWRIRFIKDWSKYKIGDTLWVRETFTILEPEHCEGMSERFYYKADHHETNEDWRLECIRYGYPYKWKPSLFMPRSACRIFLKLKKISIERLNDLSREDAIAEGVEHLYEKFHFCERYKDYSGVTNGFFDDNNRVGCSAPEASYRSLWAKINGFDSLNSNPFVWVYEFERCEASFACS